MNRELQKKVAEAVLFLSEEPVKLERMASVLQLTAEEADHLIGELQRELAASGRGLQVFTVAGGYQMGTLPEIAPYLEKAFSEEVSGNLSNAALEALAIIAYKQPVTRIEIESIRGVRSEHVLENLLKRRLIRVSGRKEGPGRPLLYSTTPDFLKYFGLNGLDDLPPLENTEQEAKFKTEQAAPEEG
ncbi:MAG TPA: SMC-Scp complex subunit ScpB [Firmicutes bacterium]|nr:SMC-Scp complex subunit ScpB [Bacillota bacterium]